MLYTVHSSLPARRSRVTHCALPTTCQATTCYTLCIPHYLPRDHMLHNVHSPLPARRSHATHCAFPTSCQAITRYTRCIPHYLPGDHTVLRESAAAFRISAGQGAVGAARGASPADSGAEEPENRNESGFVAKRLPAQGRGSAAGRNKTAQLGHCGRVRQETGRPITTRATLASSVLSSSIPTSLPKSALINILNAT